MPHRDAPLTETGRLRPARCVVEDGRPLHRAAERFQDAGRHPASHPARTTWQAPDRALTFDHAPHAQDDRWILYGRGGDLNRPAWSIKGNVCKPIRPTNSTGLDCDEHPFGATWEGPAAGDELLREVPGPLPEPLCRGNPRELVHEGRHPHKDKLFVKILPRCPQ